MKLLPLSLFIDLGKPLMAQNLLKALRNDEESSEARASKCTALLDKHEKTQPHIFVVDPWRLVATVSFI